ncbi:MAG: bacillithiol biosynthesis cysteine-adding enzyme BshC [Bacteroidetes bacterium]|nr:bacillithiol biosynthesis cysteine-adding enzyme BshC [Bacteroidota bacterium]
MSVFQKKSIKFDLTKSFDSLPVDYVDGKPDLAPFYNVFPSIENCLEIAKSRSTQEIDRKLLVEVISEQYKIAGIDLSGLTQQNLLSILDPKTFTVTTGHQLNLFTGPLYFIYKILSTISLAEKLSKNGVGVVPVYWMASEDHDMEEIRSATIFSQKIEWETDWTGASGKAKCTGIALALDQLKQKMGTLPGADELFKLMSDAYTGAANLGVAMRKLVHSLFHKYGLIILDADDARLKSKFLPVIVDDLKTHSAEAHVSKVIADLGKNYNIQVHPRNINLFYLTSDKRERIVLNADRYEVLDSNKSWSKDEIIAEVRNHPERFSPNVVIRPLYQESILPNIAVIGGPSEIAYWLEYKSTFDFFGIPFPALILRASLLLIDSPSHERMKKFNILPEQIFDSSDAWLKNYFKNTSELSFSISDSQNTLEVEFNRLAEEVSRIDASLKSNVEAELQRMKNALKTIEEKVIRAKKKKSENEVNQIVKLKEKLFPNNSLQERIENFIPFYLRYGTSFFDELLLNIDPFDQRFIILTEK